MPGAHLLGLSTLGINLERRVGDVCAARRNETRQLGRILLNDMSLKGEILGLPRIWKLESKAYSGYSYLEAPVR